MAAITLLTSGAQAQSGTSSAVDVSANGQIRMTITALPDHGKDPELDVFFDTAPAAAGPFREIEAVKMVGNAPPGSPYLWDSAKRVVLDEADDFLRVRWTLRYQKNWSGVAETFTMGIVGTGVVSG